MTSKRYTEKPTYLYSFTSDGFAMVATNATQLEVVQHLNTFLQERNMHPVSIHMRRDGRTGWRADVKAVTVGDGTSDDMAWMD